MSQVHLFIGPNAYGLYAEKKRWTQGFRQKHGDENLVALDADKIAYRELRDEVAMGPFIAEKRLIVLSGIPKGKKGDVESVLQQLHPSALLLVVLETEIGKRAKYTIVQKDVKAAAEVKEFPNLSTPELQAWLDSEATALGSSFEASARDLLIEKVGADQLLLHQEVQKLSLYAAGRSITPADVLLLAACSMEQEIWQLMDHLGTGKPEQALSFAYSLLDRGLSPIALWNTFLWMTALLPQVCSAVEQGMTNPWDISKDMKISYPGAKALLPVAKRLSLEQLSTLIAQIVDADKAIKTGSIRATAEAPEEILALIDHSLLAFSKA